MKILIISHNSFSTTYNNGKTLSAIFSAFSKEELCQLYFTPIGSPDYDRCLDYYLITDKDALRSILSRRNCGTKNVVKEDVKGSGSIKNKHSLFAKYARTIVWALSSWYYGGLKKWLSEQKPEVIFYVGGDGIFSHRIAVGLSKKLGIPLATYFTDDYVINPKTDLYVRLLKHYYKKTIKQSSLLFAIGEQMAESYSEYYKKKFLPIMNIVEIPYYEPNYEPGKKVLKINYFGGLHLGRAKEISRFGEFIRKKVEPYIKRRVEINIYTFSQVSYELKEDYNRLNICLNSGVTGVELENAMNNTDMFLHVESIDPQYKSLTKLSVSTKIPEYFSKARPIIAFGPKEVASFGVIESVIPEFVLDDNNSIYVNTAKLIDVLNNDDKLKEFAHRGYEYAKAKFDKALVSKRFKEELNEVHYQHDKMPVNR